MFWFLLTFFSVYGGAHLYFFSELRKAVQMSHAGSVLVSAVLVLAALSPLLIRVLERWNAGFAARALAYPGYFWMGFLFLFICWSILFKILNLVGGGVSLILGFEKSLEIGAGMFFWLPVMLSVLVMSYGYHEARNIRVEYVDLEVPKLPDTEKPIRIVQLADLHLGLIERDSRVEEVVRIVMGFEPDLIVSTGDLVDGQMYDIGYLAERLAQLNPPLGKFAVLGNHEFYAGVSDSVEFLKNGGFRVLRGEAVDLTDHFRIVGLDDPVGEIIAGGVSVRESDLLMGSGGARFVLLLKHRPVWDRHLLGEFDLQLSGHTHRGQIFPFRYVTKLFYPEDSGLHRLGMGSFLYVSRGTGTWGPKVRVLAPPEITVINIWGRGIRATGGSAGGVCRSKSGETREDVD